MIMTTFRIPFLPLCLLMMVLRTGEPHCESSDPLSASIVPENKDVYLVSPPVNILEEINYYKNRVMSVVGGNTEFNIQFASGAKTWEALSSCEHPRKYTLRVDINMYDVLRQINEQSIEFTLAHEIGHFLQYQAQPNLVGMICKGHEFDHRFYELMADFVAGYALTALYRDQVNFSLLYTISRLSDYEFTNIDHHGTVTERNSAYGMGGFAYFFDKPLDMEKLISNKSRFENLLFTGPPKVSGKLQKQVYRDSIEELFE